MSFSDQNSFQRFDRAVRREFRFARTSEQARFLHAVEETCSNRKQVLKAGMCLYRAQLGHAWREEEIAPDVFEDVPAPYSALRMKPDLGHFTDGRVNARGIPCLYLSTHEKTAAAEVRPLSGTHISMGLFTLRRELCIVDCSQKLIGSLVRFTKEDWSSDDIEKQVWTDINDAFSKPTDRGDNHLDYVPTQIIAETIRLKGFDGIAYKSSLEEGFNLALFNLDDADLRRCAIMKVKIKVEPSETGDAAYHAS